MDNTITLLLIIIAILAFLLIISIICLVILYRKLKEADWELSWFTRL